MARYYFHVEDAGSVTADDEGADFASLSQVHDQVATIAGEILTSELQCGRTDVVFTIRVENPLCGPVLALEVRGVLAAVAGSAPATAGVAVPDRGGDSAG
jgi:hypothetical protein